MCSPVKKSSKSSAECVTTCWQKVGSPKQTTPVGPMYSKVTQYGLTGILICLALGSYLTFLADRDAKMMDYYDKTTQENVF